MSARDPEHIDYDERRRFDDLMASVWTHLAGLSASDVDPGIEEILGRVTRFADVDRSFLFLFSEDHARVTNTHEYNGPGVPSRRHLFQSLPIDTFGWFYRTVLREGRAQIHRLVELPPEAEPERRQCEREGIKSSLSVGISSQGKVVGFLGFNAMRAEKRWEEDKIRQLRILGEMFFGALQRKQAEEALREKLTIIEQQRAAIQRLSAPIIQVWTATLVVPVIGLVDREGAAMLAQSLLEAVVQTRSRYAILDLTAVHAVDESTAAHLAAILGALRLVGATGVVSGISPAVAQTMVSVGIDLTSVKTLRTLEEAVRSCAREGSARAS